MVGALKQLPTHAPLVVATFKYMEAVMVSELCPASELVDRGAPAASMSAMGRHPSRADLQVHSNGLCCATAPTAHVSHA